MGFTLSTKYLVTANESEYDQIKRVLEPFRQIFMTILENAENDCVSHFTIDRTYNPAVITLHPANGNNFSVSAKGRAAFPLSIPYDMQTAILKFNQCDLSVLSLLCWIRDALRPTGATVDWLMIVSVRPLSILHYSDEEPVTRNGRHSVLAITTASGEQYIADFTIEQFGYPAELWFLRKQTILHALWRQEQVGALLPRRTWTTRIVILQSVIFSNPLGPVLMLFARKSIG